MVIFLLLEASLGKQREGTYCGGNVSVPSYETKYVVDETENWDDGEY